MQKIIFVSIILLTGLFSLQLQLAQKSSAYFHSPPEQKQTIAIPASFANPQRITIYYICPDSILPVCKKAEEDHICL